jgi:prepilin-type N-terminal cleavage/methylation domain-containing protein
MKTSSYITINDQGFTLLEIVITLVVASILGAVLAQYMSTVLSRSTEPITFIQESFSLNRIIEEMTTDYENLLETDNDPLATLETYIDNGNVETNDPYYGQYSPATDYILFIGQIETPDATEKRILKTTITKSNQSITVLFTK